MNQDFIEKVKKDFPQFNFKESEDFRWNFESRTIFFTDSPNFETELLHELGHALCEHKNYTLDIDLLKMETEAWQKAFEISQKYNVKISKNIAENNLDTYRDWLHKRSLCPKCLINGFQSKNLDYNCLACGMKWRNNDSRFKSLRRMKK